VLKHLGLLGKGIRQPGRRRICDYDSLHCHEPARKPLLNVSPFCVRSVETKQPACRRSTVDTPVNFLGVDGLL
jgi:hypothetical protein